MTKKIIIFLILLIFISIWFVLFAKKHENRVILGNKTFFMEIANTDASRERGLSSHTALLDNQGMLFIFDKPGNYGFWMKDMIFPIDILWIDANFKIIDIESAVATSTYPKI